MDTDNQRKVIPLFPDLSADEAASSGWDPYIFSMVAGADRPYRQERRRAPRVNTPTSRRALLLSRNRPRDNA